MIQLPEAVTVVRKEGTTTVFEIGPLMPGYGATVANPLRRVLLSSLEGAAVTSLKIKGVDHEFAAIPGVQEDIIQIILNLKKLRFRAFTSDPVVLNVSAKGETTITGEDIQLTSDVELCNPEQVICTVTDKKVTLDMELTIEKGRGYVSVEQRQKEKLPIGVIAVDAAFSPVRLVNFTIEDVRVGQRIDFNKIVMEVQTDGSIQPEQAMKEAATILADHFNVVAQIAVPEPEAKPAKKAAKKSKKTE
ncbi:MAG: DNA-directed RNA polymerase subunit alpha [Candidatus Yanofskybacteria bacterium]|nr:DNA-directed RNA polymerase subunit alpha [Candidatus Yanofskybacteria bacterium]